LSHLLVRYALVTAGRSVIADLPHRDRSGTVFRANVGQFSMRMYKSRLSEMILTVITRFDK